MIAGVGFVAGGKVIDRTTLKTTIAAIFSFLGFIVPLLLAFRPEVVVVVGADVCSLNARQVLGIKRTIASSPNSTCSFDTVSIGSVLRLKTDEMSLIQHAPVNGLLLEQFASSHALGAPVNTSTVPLMSASVALGSDALSLRLIGSWTPAADVDISIVCATPGLASDHLIVWIDDHTMCDTHSWTGWQGPSVGPAGIRLAAKKTVMVRAELHRAVANASAPLALAVTQKSGGGALAPTAELSPVVPLLQQRRLVMQRGLLQGWNSWWSTIGAKPGFRGGMLSVALLPESFAITMAMCQISSGRCVAEATVAGTLTHDRVRPGMKGLNASYAELWATAVRVPTTWTILQQDGPNHLGLWYNVLPEHQIALITSGCVPCSRAV